MVASLTYACESFFSSSVRRSGSFVIEETKEEGVEDLALFPAVEEGEEDGGECRPPPAKRLRRSMEDILASPPFMLEELPFLQLVDEVPQYEDAEDEEEREEASQPASTAEEEEESVSQYEESPSPHTEQSFISSLLDNNRNLLGTIELSFLDEDESVMLGSTLLVEAEDNNGAGVLFRSVLWQSRKSAVIDLPNGWEMHLVAESADADQLLTGYLCPMHLPQLVAQREVDTLLETRKLAAAIDVDDTLVKSIPPDALSMYEPHRLKTLRSIPLTIALAVDAEYFLRKAARKYKLCLYSLGTSEYVREVAEVLDPDHTLLDWDSISSGISSARHEFSEGKESTPKKLERVFSFANQEDGTLDHSMCLGVDDNPGVWEHTSREQVLKVEIKRGREGTWNSNLKKVWRTMHRHHRRFYKARKQQQMRKKNNNITNTNINADEKENSAPNTI